MKSIQKCGYAMLALWFGLQSTVLVAQDQFARGADIGWLTEMEGAGQRFLNDNGQEQDLLEILQDHCINAIRLRVWVNPSDGWCGKDDVIAKAKRGDAKGFRLMIDFHYSDSWADPGKQTKPIAWKSYSVAQLSQAIYDHTHEMLNSLKQEGITPQWVQIGNETNNGMLWDDGKASVDMANYAMFVSSGNNAAKAVFPHIITIVHVANGFDSALFRWNIGGLVSNGALFDAVGMSLYPEPENWQTLASECYANMQDIVANYNKKIVVTEIGMTWSAPSESKSLIEDMIENVQSLPNQQGIGVFWWEPQCNNDWKGYSKGTWGNDMKPTVALDGFMANCSPQYDCNREIDGHAELDNCGRCTKGKTEKYPCTHPDEGYYTMVAVHSSLCLSSEGDLTQQGCDADDPTKIWKLEKSGDFYRLYSIAEKQYVRYSIAENGADVGFGTGSNELFFFEQHDDGSIIITPVQNEYVVFDVFNASAKPGGIISFWDRNGGEWQRFVLNEVEERFDCQGVWNGTAYFDYCGQCVGGTTGAQACSVAIVEAEDQSCLFDGVVENSNDGFCGSGYIKGNNAPKALLTFKLYAARMSEVLWGARFANGGEDDRPCKIFVNGKEAVSSFSMPVGAWNQYSLASTQLILFPGINTVVLEALSPYGFANFDQFFIQGDAEFADCGVESQMVPLNEGWNLFSTNIHPIDSSISILFNSVNLSEIKNFDSYWQTGQPEYLNTLQAITAGEGYLVKMRCDSSLIFIGKPVDTLSVYGTDVVPGWRLIGVPFQIARPFSTVFDSDDCLMIKDFDGFWMPGGNANSIDSLVPGKSYFVK